MKEYGKITNALLECGRKADRAPLYEVTFDKYPAQVNFLGNKEKKCLWSKMQQNRISVALPHSDRYYTGCWYYQGKDSATCLPLSVANACLALNTTVDRKCMQEMVDFARGITNSGRKGMFFYEALEIINKYPNMPLIANVTSPMSQEQTSENLSRHTAGVLRNDDKWAISVRFGLSIDNFNAHVEPDGYSSVSSESHEGNDYFQNAAAGIVAFIDAGCVILTAVNCYRYLLAGGLGSHAVCISGYNVDEKGQMNVQLIDSKKGIFCTSFEHVYESQWPLYTFAAARPVIK